MKRPEVLIAGVPTLFEARGRLSVGRLLEQLRALLNAIQDWLTKPWSWLSER